MARVELRNVKKIYPHDGGKAGGERAEGGANLQITEQGVVAVQQFDLDIADKEFIVLVGPSGCGKSTTLRMIAGLEEITAGEIYIDGKKVNDTPPKDRDISMVFQNYALFPHMTVYDNIAFSLKMQKKSKAEIDKKVREAAEILDITDYLRRKPKALSGGQRQRVAIGRAIVRDAAVFLMDEPLSNLDAKRRGQMRTELIKLRKKLDTTFVYVTHDQTEAMTLGDRIVIMQDGFIRQAGTPMEVFNEPRNKFVAGFIGTPQMNFFEAELVREGGYYVQLGELRVRLSEEKQRRLAALEVPEQRVCLGVRPEHLRNSESGARAMVELVELMGSTVHVHLDYEGLDIVLIVPTEELHHSVEVGQEICFDFDGALAHVFDMETEQNLEWE